MNPSTPPDQKISPIDAHLSDGDGSSLSTHSETSDNLDRSISKYCLAYHVWWLVGCLTVLALAASLRTRGSRQVMVPGIQMALPEICVFRRNTGLDCPGCGLTRSFIAMTGGDWTRAWGLNPAAYLVYALVVLQIPYRILQIGRLLHGQQALHMPGLQWLMWLLAAALIGQWLVKLVLRLA